MPGAPEPSQSSATIGPVTSPPGAKMSGATSPVLNVWPPTTTLEPPPSTNAEVVKASSCTCHPDFRRSSATRSAAASYPREPTDRKPSVVDTASNASSRSSIPAAVIADAGAIASAVAPGRALAGAGASAPATLGSGRPVAGAVARVVGRAEVVDADSHAPRTSAASSMAARSAGRVTSRMVRRARSRRRRLLGRSIDSTVMSTSTSASDEPTWPRWAPIAIVVGIIVAALAVLVWLGKDMTFRDGTPATVPDRAWQGTGRRPVPHDASGSRRPGQSPPCAMSRLQPRSARISSSSRWTSYCRTRCCRTSCCRTRCCRTSELPDHELPLQLLPRPAVAGPRVARPRVAAPAVAGPAVAGPRVPVPSAARPRVAGQRRGGHRIRVEGVTEDVHLAGDHDAVVLHPVRPARAFDRTRASRIREALGRTAGWLGGEHLGEVASRQPPGPRSGPPSLTACPGVLLHPIRRETRVLLEHEGHGAGVIAAASEVPVPRK